MTSLEENNLISPEIDRHGKLGQRSPMLDHLFAQLGEEFSFMSQDKNETKT